MPTLPNCLLTFLKGVVKLDPYLSPFQDSLKRRFNKTQEWVKKLNETEGGLDKFSKVRIRLLPLNACSSSNMFSRRAPIPWECT